MRRVWGYLFWMFWGVLLLALYLAGSELRIHLGSYEIITSGSFALLSILVVWWVLRFCWRLIVAILCAPWRFCQWLYGCVFGRQNHHKKTDSQKEQKNLIYAYAAFMRQDEKAAFQCLEGCTDQVDNSYILLQANAAFERCDYTLAQDRFTLLTHAHEHHFRLSGYYGLYQIAQGKKDHLSALRYSEKLYQGRKLWQYGFLYLRSLAQNGRWQQAYDVVKAMSVPVEEKQKWQASMAVICTNLGENYWQQRQHFRAQYWAWRALRYDDAFLPAYLLLIQTYSVGRYIHKAENLIRKAWKHCSHPLLLEAYSNLQPLLTPQERYQKVQSLFISSGDPSQEPNLILPYCAFLLAGRQCDKLQQILLNNSTLLSSYDCSLLNLALKAIERSQEPVADMILEHLEKRMRHFWQCKECGHVSMQWHAVCPECTDFATMSLQTSCSPAMPPEILDYMGENSLFLSMKATDIPDVIADTGQVPVLDKRE